jgi:hypothetical protein
MEQFDGLSLTRIKAASQAIGNHAACSATAL